MEATVPSIEQQEAINFALEASGMGAWIFYPLNRTVYWDARGRELFGIEKGGAHTYEEALSRIHPDDLERVTRAVEASIDPAKKAPYNIEYRVIPNGHIVWLRCKGKAYFNEGNVAYRFAGVCQDITEEVMREAALWEYEQKFTAAFKMASVGMIITNRDGKFIMVNDTVAKMLDYTVEELMGKDSYFISFEDDFTLLQNIYKELFENNLHSVSLDRKFKSKSGKVVWAKNDASLIKNPDGTVNGAIAIIKDISDEIALRKQQQHLKILADNSVDLMSILSMDGTNTYINKAGKKLLGLPTDADESKIPISSFHTPDQIRFVETEILPKAMEHGRWSGRFAIKQLGTNEIIPLENNCIRIDDPLTGQPIGIGAVMRDLRPELLANKALMDSEQRFRTMVEQAPVAIAIFHGPDMLIESANPMMLEIWGKGAQILGLPFAEVLPEAKGQWQIENLLEVFQNGKRVSGFENQLVLFKNNGAQQYYFNYIFDPLRDPNDEIIGAILVMTDVTEQVLAKQELESIELRFRNLILEAPMPTALYVGRELVIELANEAMIKLWGKDATVISKPLAEALPELDGQPFLEILDKVFTTGETYHADEQSADLIVDGVLQTFWFNFTYKPLFDKDGKVYAVLNMALDISQHVHLKRQKDEFLGIASHELKTPVTSIKAYAQVLEQHFRNKGDMQEASMLSRMGTQVNKLSKLIEDLLDVTKIQAGKLLFNESYYELNDLAAEIVEEVQRTSDKHKIFLHRATSITIYGDRDRIGQVITNLLTNAIKYSYGADKVIVRITNQGSSALLSVEDFGIGIAKEKLPRVFEQFYQVGNLGGTVSPGLGLGLYISSEIIRRQGGQIWAESQEGTGSTFTFALPIDYRQIAKGD
ncbi:MAG: PAS domain S-box protein [Chitinophagales bacterium]|nr:PAS domain S-box protein [Chitinophagales bacterium]